MPRKRIEPSPRYVAAILSAPSLNCRHRQAELQTVALKAACAEGEAEQRPLGDRHRRLRHRRHQAVQDLAVPALGMLHIEDGVELEIVPRLARNPEPLPPR